MLKIIGKEEMLVLTANKKCLRRGCGEECSHGKDPRPPTELAREKVEKGGKTEDR